MERSNENTSSVGGGGGGGVYTTVACAARTIGLLADVFLHTGIDVVALWIPLAMNDGGVKLADVDPHSGQVFLGITSLAGINGYVLESIYDADADADAEDVDGDGDGDGDDPTK